MNNRFINEILNEYEISRTEAEEDARIRQLELYNKIPRIRDIDSELGSIGIDIAKSVFNREIDIEELIRQKKQKAVDLKIEKAELLTLNNYALDYSYPKYKCANCQDTGYIGSQRCACFKQKIIDKHYNQSNLKEIVQRENFEMFVFDYYSGSKFEGESLSPRKNIEEIFKDCVNFVNTIDSNNSNLFFYGKSGLGKTFLSNCIAKDLLDRGKLVIYQTSSNLIEQLKNFKFQNSEGETSDRLNDIFDCDLLIIDDLGTEYITDFSQMELFNIINKRLITNKKMIISTNLSLDNIFSTYPERVTSRILGNFTMYKFYGEDIRVKIAEQKRKRKK